MTRIVIVTLTALAFALGIVVSSGGDGVEAADTNESGTRLFWHDVKAGALAPPIQPAPGPCMATR